MESGFSKPEFHQTRLENSTWITIGMYVSEGIGIHESVENMSAQITVGVRVGVGRSRVGVPDRVGVR